MIRKKLANSICLLLLFICLCTGCGYFHDSGITNTGTEAGTEDREAAATEEDAEVIAAELNESVAKSGRIETVETADWFDVLPAYLGTPYVEVNKDIPFFTEEEKKRTDAFETYRDLDDLGRCGVAYANICEEIMPTKEREDSLSSVTPSGWCQNMYDGEWLLNRCHLIGYQLAGETVNEKNLIAGTRYFNVEGMLPFENTVADYIDDNPYNHVLYRVTPIYKDENDLMAYGVLMEAWSVEDNGYGCQFCVFVYNVQQGIEIDYATGKNCAADETLKSDSADTKKDSTYILNTNSKKFHREDCSNAGRISDKNKSVYTGDMDDLISQGYSPAECCNP